LLTRDHVCRNSFNEENGNKQDGEFEEFHGEDTLFYKLQIFSLYQEAASEDLFILSCDLVPISAGIAQAIRASSMILIQVLSGEKSTWPSAR
jgi:hypothetical protein